jgi:hypothetical protein
MSAVVRDELPQRNRRTLKILLAIMATLVLASLLVGIRW